MMTTKISEMLNAEHINAIVYSDAELPVIYVEIDWGDWKHSHLRAKRLIEKNFNVTYFGENITDENGSDCYSATHIFLYYE